MLELARIVHIDDDPDDRLLFRLALAEEAGLDFEFEEFGECRAALDYLQRQDGRPVIAVFDLGVCLNELESMLGAANRAIGIGGVGIVTGALTPDWERRCRAAGAAFVLVKPVNAERFADHAGKLPGIAVMEAEGRRRLCRAPGDGA